MTTISRHSSGRRRSRYSSPPTRRTARDSSSRRSAVSREQYDIALNAVNTLKADRDNLVSSIRKREIRAPFDGVAGLRYVSEGGYVTQSTRIASVQKLNPLKVDFAIPEKYAGQVAVGDQVQFSSDESNLRFTGKLYAIEPKIDPLMGTLQLRAICDNRGEKIFPGAFVRIDLRLRTIEDALVVPTQAVIPVFKGQTVLLRRAGVCRLRPRQNRDPHRHRRPDHRRPLRRRHGDHDRHPAAPAGDARPGYRPVIILPPEHLVRAARTSPA